MDMSFPWRPELLTTQSKSKKVATLTSHPTYRNPTIQEAVCEFQFKTDEPSSWSPNKPGPLLIKLGENYADFETISEQGVQVVIGKDGPIPQLLAPKLKLKFNNATKPIIVQASQNSFSINALRPYQGWATLRDEIFRVWPVFIDVIRPVSISRVGMRYINRISRQRRDETPGYWFKESMYIPSAFLSSGANFLSRLEHRSSDKSRLIVTVAYDDSIPTEHFGSILFDIDCIEEGFIDIDQSKIAAVIEKLHDDIWKVFESSKGENLESLLNGGKSQ